MDAARSFRQGAAAFNRVVMLPLLDTGLGQRTLGRSFAHVTYRGRKSGKTVTLVTNYTRKGNDVRMAVAAPEAKTWWRNFTGEGSPMQVTLGTETYDAHAVATQDAKGRVRLKVALKK